MTREASEVIDKCSNLFNQELDNKTVDSALSELTAVSLREENIASLCENVDLIRNLLALAETVGPNRTGISALINLCNMAIHPMSHDLLLELDALPIAIKNLRYLRDGCTKAEFSCGLSSAFLICRTVGREESGPGPDAIKGNPILLDKLAWVLTMVLDAGPNGVVIDSKWDPANIMLDIATLATSDRNKHLLVRFVPLIVRAVRERGLDNFALVKHSSHALSQLMFHEQCKLEMINMKQEIAEALQLVDNFKSGQEYNQVNKNIQVLLATLNASVVSPANPRRASVSSMWRRLSTVMIPPTDKTRDANQHVMISYQWNSQNTAKELERVLAAAGYKTWFDMQNMGANINDSMAEAIENSWLVVSLVSRKYKESANCRKELEYAEVAQKPIVYIKVEEHFNPAGWLALVMGKALWIACFSVDEMEISAWPQLQRRITYMDTSKPATIAPTQKGNTQQDMWDNMLGMIQSLQRENADIKQDNARIKTQLAALQHELNNKN